MTSPPDYWEYEGSRRKPRWLPKKAPPSATGDRYEQPPDSGISVRAATDALQAAPDLDRFTEVFNHTVDDGHGAFAQIHQFLESAANWCHDHGAPGAAGELGTWAIRLEELIEDARLLPENLTVEVAPSPTRSTAAYAARVHQTQGMLMNDSLPDSPASGASTAADPVAWRRHVPALAAAAVGIKQASDAWDAVSDSFCDQDGWPHDEQGYADGKVKRDAEAWKHVEVFLDHGPEVLAGVRAAATGADWVEGPISDDLRAVHGVDAALKRAAQIRNEWDNVIALMDASLPGSRELYQERAREHRNSEGWHYADELSFHGPGLVRAAEYLASRADAEEPSRTERARVALTRSASGDRGATPATPPAHSPAPPQASAPRRSR